MEKKETIVAPPLTTERAVEIPWALSRYNGGPRILEVGCSFASENPEYIAGLKGLGGELHGIDISSVPAPDFIQRTADIRASGYDDAFFDMVFCISTIEHVGRDNARHYFPVAEIENSAESDRDALSEILSDYQARRNDYLDGPVRTLRKPRLVYQLRRGQYRAVAPRRTHSGAGIFPLHRCWLGTVRSRRVSGHWLPRQRRTSSSSRRVLPNCSLTLRESEGSPLPIELRDGRRDVRVHIVLADLIPEKRRRAVAAKTSRSSTGTSRA
jgi:hypothetical protein